MRVLPVLAALTLSFAQVPHAAAQEAPDLVPPEPQEEIVVPEEAIELPPSRLGRERRQE